MLGVWVAYTMIKYAQLSMGCKSNTHKYIHTQHPHTTPTRKHPQSPPSPHTAYVGEIRYPHQQPSISSKCSNKLPIGSNGKLHKWTSYSKPGIVCCIIGDDKDGVLYCKQHLPCGVKGEGSYGGLERGGGGGGFQRRGGVDDGKGEGTEGKYVHSMYVANQVHQQHTLLLRIPLTVSSSPTHSVIITPHRIIITPSQCHHHPPHAHRML